MSYHPQVGDRVTDTNLEDEGTVLYVHGKQAVVLFDGDEAVVLYWPSEIIKVKPRPKIAECVGYLSHGDGFNHCPKADTAQWQEEHKNLTPARIKAIQVWFDGQTGGDFITVAVVCDLDGNPLEVQR